MTDPYKTLGVAPTASADEIRSAYRKLVKTLHPDLHPGDKALEDRFKAVSAAYEFLSNAEQRRRFDAGEIDAAGVEQRPRSFYRDFAADGGHPYQSRAGFADMFGDDDVLEQILRQAARRGRDVGFRLVVPFLDAINGGQREVTLGDGRKIDVTIPAGVQDGTLLRVRGGGIAGEGGAAGDALIEIAISPHPFFTRVGDDIHMELPVSLNEAVLGAKVEAPTTTGKVLLTIPRGAETGQVLRLRGKGAPRAGGRGDQLVTLKVVLPPGPKPELEAFLNEWEAGKSFNPRRELP